MANVQICTYIESSIMLDTDKLWSIISKLYQEHAMDMVFLNFKYTFVRNIDIVCQAGSLLSCYNHVFQLPNTFH